MKDRTTLLFGLDEFVVVDVSRVEDATVRVVIETLAREGACPECGTLSARVKDRPVRRVKDLPCSGQRVELWWRKRRLVCLPAACPRRSFLERTAAIPPRSRLTVRLAWRWRPSWSSRRRLSAAVRWCSQASFLIVPR